MKIKYRKSDNVIVAMGACDFTADADHDVLEVNQDIPNETISNFKLEGSEIKKRDQAEIDAEEAPKKNARKNQKREVLDALVSVTGLTKAKILKGLKMLLEDENDN